MRKLICTITVAGLTVLAVILIGAFNMVDAAEYSMAIVPQQGPKIIYSRWTPVVKHLERETGDKITITFFDNIQKFETAIMQGTFDIVYTNPYHVYLLGKQGYTPLIRDGKKKLSGIIVVHKKSLIQSVSELNNHKIVFPTKSAWAASLYMRAQLKSVHKIDFEPFYVANHDNSFRATAAKQVAASCGVMKTFKSQPQRVKDALRVLWTTPGTTPHALIAGKKVPKSIQNRIVSAWIKLDSERPAMMRKAINNPIRANYNRDYAHFSQYKVEDILASQ